MKNVNVTHLHRFDNFEDNKKYGQNKSVFESLVDGEINKTILFGDNEKTNNHEINTTNA